MLNKQLAESKEPLKIINKAIQLEILIADAMNQHSQLKDKINAF